jgi:tRNA (guanine37-N1)-methyltransferase
MNYHVITLFPQAFDSYLGESILKRAIDDKKIKIKFYNPRDFTKGTSYADRRVDDRPYGGGPGMVIEALPVIKAIEKAISRKMKSAVAKKKVKIIFFAPSGKLADTAYAKNVAQKFTDIVFVCGRYEGIDARVKKAFKVEEISVGPYVLTGGELPAMLLIDTISRQIPGVLGDINSLEESRIAANDVYTRPETIEFKGKKYRVPKVLLSGNHADIEKWKQSQKNIGEK